MCLFADSEECYVARQHVEGRAECFSLCHSLSIDIQTSSGQELTHCNWFNMR